MVYCAAMEKIVEKTSSVLLLGAVLVLCLVACGTTASADVISPVPTIGEFAIYKAAPAGGAFNPQVDSYLGCVYSYMQYLSAGTSYGYKQYDNPKGYDLSAWPNSSEGVTSPGALTSTSHKTWLTPQNNPNAITGTVKVGETTYSAYSWQPNVLQFYVGWSRLDHDTNNETYATAARGYNLGVIMNQEQRYWDPVSNSVKHVPSDLSTNLASNYNNVKINFTVLGSLADPNVVLADDFSTNPAEFPSDPPYTNEMPRDPKATAELKELTPGVFAGDWTYKLNSTDGGVLGNLVPDGTTPMVIKIDLIELGNLTDIIFYNFNNSPGNYDPFTAANYDQSYVRLDLQALGVGEGDSLYLVSYQDCCGVTTPEPMTLLLLAGGGLSVVGAAVRKRLRARKAA